MNEHYRLRYDPAPLAWVLESAPSLHGPWTQVADWGDIADDGTCIEAVKRAREAVAADGLTLVHAGRTTGAAPAWYFLASQTEGASANPPDRYVIVHTDHRGQASTLAVVVYDVLAEAEKRVAERRRTAEEYGWTDRYEVFRLVPAEGS